MRKWSMVLSFVLVFLLSSCGTSLEDFNLENTEITLNHNESISFDLLLNEVPESLIVTTTNETIVEINETSLMALESGFATVVFSIEEGIIGYLEVVVPFDDSEELDNTEDSENQEDNDNLEDSEESEDPEEFDDPEEDGMLSVADIWTNTYVSEDVIEFSGIVAALTDRGYILQDVDSTDLISVWDDVNTPQVGDLLHLEGVYTESFRLISIRDLSKYTLESSGNTLNLSTDSANPIDWANYNGRDDLETGQLVKFENFFARFSATSITSYLRLGDTLESVDAQEFDSGYYIGLQIGANNLNLGDITDLFSAAIGETPFDFDGVTLYAMIYDSSSSYDKYIILNSEHIMGLEDIVIEDESNNEDSTSEENEDDTSSEDDTSNDDTYANISSLHQNASVDDIVQISGVVSSLYTDGYFIEDAEGVQLNIYNPGGTFPPIGSNVTVMGEYSNYYTNYQLGGNITYTLNSQNNNVSNTPITLDISELGSSFDLEDKNNHGKLIRITGLLIEKTPGQYTNLFIEDENSNAEVMIYWESDSDSLSYLEQYLGEVITITVRYYTNHPNNGIMVTFLKLEGNIE